jgi:pentatricopeptide repeat protein
VRYQSKSGSYRNLNDALDVFDRMLHMHPLPSTVGFSQFLGAVARMKHHSIVITLIKGMERSVIAPYACTLGVLKGMEQSVIISYACTLGVLINCFCHLNRVDFSFSILTRILKLGFQLNCIILNTLVKGLCLQSKLAETMKLVNIMEKIGYKPDAVTYRTIMNGLCKIGETTY